jgi:molybdopterin-guanine dinucleotide biosynthesis protein A
LAVASIVLVGGKSLRLGRDKVFETIDGENLLQRVVTRLAPLTDRVILVAAPGQSLPPLPPHLETSKVVDIYPGKGSLGGIYTGLLASDRSHSLVVACDMPFLNLALLRHLIRLCPRFDAVIPRITKLLEPLHAVYSKSCLAAIEALLQQNNLRITDLFNQIRVRYVEEDEIDRFDPERLSFFNINTAADLERARALAGGNPDD